MIQGIDHLVILLDDLDEGIRQYRDLGFTVTPGGKHPRGTHNALVAFQDGSYLELIAFYEPDYEAHRWHKYLGTGGGIIDHALATDDLPDEISGAGTRGIVYEGPHDGARTRPDGVELQWRMGTTAQENGQALPFLIDDVTDRDLRVPTGDARTHPNGILGIDRLLIAVRDVEDAATKYATLLDTDPLANTEATRTEQDTTAVVLQAGQHQIEIHQPDGGGPMAEQLARRGEGPYAAVFFGTEEREFDPAAAGNARLSVIRR